MLVLVAAGEHTGAVPQSQCTTLRSGGEAPGAAQVQHVADLVGDHQGDLAGAGETFGSARFEGSCADDMTHRRRSRGNVGRGIGSEHGGGFEDFGGPDAFGRPARAA